MSAAAARPPPPPPGGDCGKGPGHNSPGSNKGSSPIASRDRGDGNSAKTAWWSYGLWSNPNQAHYLGEARYDFDTGYPIYRIVNGTARRIGTVINQQAMNSTRGDPFYDHFRQIEQEERDRVGCHESVGYEEDIIEVNLDEEFKDQNPAPFDKAMSPSRRGRSTLNSIHTPNQADINCTGSRSFRGYRSTSPTGAPSTPHRRSPGSVLWSLSPNRQGHSASPPLLPGFTSPRDNAPTSSPRDRGLAASPHGGSSQRHQQGQDYGSPRTPSGGSGARRSGGGGTQ